MVREVKLMRTLREMRTNVNYRNIIYPFNRLFIELKQGRPVDDGLIVECKHEIFKATELMKKKLNRRKITLDEFEMIDANGRELNRTIDRLNADDLDFESVRFCLQVARNM